MTPKPCFYVNFNVQTCHPYHNENVFSTAAKVLSQDANQTVWSFEGTPATLTEIYTTYQDAGISACRQTTTVTNTGDSPLVVDTLSSVFVSDIGKEGRPWYEKRFVVHYAHSVWQGEGQWRSAYAEDVGLYPTYNHGHQSKFRMSSTGSWTTSGYHPVLILEDTELGEAWYFEIHASTGWCIEVNAKGYKEDTSLCVFLSAAFEKNDGWFVSLAKGESYTTCPAVWGKVKGGFEEAIAELTVYRRLTYHTQLSDGAPACFNDYMNCLWANPTRDRLIPLIDAARNAGAEIFCIDAGWFWNGNPDVHWSETLGDWRPNDALFGEEGLAGIINYIKEKGMLPGVWLEIESIHLSSKFAKAHPEALLRRHGCPIGAPTSSLDFRQPVAREHIMKVFDYLYDMGVRFVKNDYNHSVGIAADSIDGGECSVAHMQEHMNAFLSFVDEVIAKHPGLMIENCGSGAMRCDHGTLSHFHIQSTSDQEYFDRYPSIIQGMLACMPPERAGIWAYPYPIDFHKFPAYPEIYPAPEGDEMAAISDPWQTAFNMVNGLMGCLYLSGRICYADEQGMKLISDAISLYKKNRLTVKDATPVYPTGMARLSYTGFATLGLFNPKANKLLLAVWRAKGDKDTLTVDLSKYLGDTARLVTTYPHLDGMTCAFADKHLTVTFTQDIGAAYFELDL